MKKPLFKKGDTAYLIASANIGHLEGYQIGDVRANSKQWQYRIDFHKKPPEQATVGDRWDLRPVETPIYYSEAELTTICDALNIIMANLNRQLNSINATLALQCTNISIAQNDGSKFSINDKIWFVTSAKVGFLHTAIIETIDGCAVTSASPDRRYKYIMTPTTVRRRGSWPPLFFYEDEICTLCEAAHFVKSSLSNQLLEMQQRFDKYCKVI